MLPIGLKRDCQKGIKNKMLAEWLHIINTYTEGERLVLGMKYLDENTAGDELTKHGYIITDAVNSEYVRTCIDKQELKLTDKMLKEFYESVLSEVE